MLTDLQLKNFAAYLRYCPPTLLGVPRDAIGAYDSARGAAGHGFARTARRGIDVRAFDRGGAFDSASNPDADELLKIEAESDIRETAKRESGKRAMDDESDGGLNGIEKMRRFLRSCRAKMDDDAFYAMIDALAGEDDDLAGDDLPSRKEDGLPENALAAMDAATPGLAHIRDLAGGRPVPEVGAAPRRRSSSLDAAAKIAPGVTRITIGG